VNNFKDLANFDSIAWDIDGTLVDSPMSEKFREFITKYPDKNHCLMTFRTHQLVNLIESDLAKAGFKDISIFKAVYCIPEIIWLNWAVVNDQRRLGKITGKLLYPEIQYMEWKGFTCKTHGYKALVRQYQRL
jgi:capsule polysaccharide modification protein KpsS